MVIGPSRWGGIAGARGGRPRSAWRHWRGRRRGGARLRASLRSASSLRRCCRLESPGSGKMSAAVKGARHDRCRRAYEALRPARLTPLRMQQAPGQEGTSAATARPCQGEPAALRQSNCALRIDRCWQSRHVIRRSAALAVTSLDPVPSTKTAADFAPGRDLLGAGRRPSVCLLAGLSGLVAAISSTGSSLTFACTSSMGTSSLALASMRALVDHRPAHSGALTAPVRARAMILSAVNLT